MKIGVALLTGGGFRFFFFDLKCLWDNRLSGLKL